MRPEVREQVRIAPDIARVLGKVFFVVELGGINEDRDKTYIVLADAASDERGMPRVECTHRRHQPDGLVLLFASLYMLEEFLLGGDDLHIALIEMSGRGARGMPYGARISIPET